MGATPEEVAVIKGEPLPPRDNFPMPGVERDRERAFEEFLDRNYASDILTVDSSFAEVEALVAQEDGRRAAPEKRTDESNSKAESLLAPGKSAAEEEGSKDSEKKEAK